MEETTNYMELGSRKADFQLKNASCFRCLSVKSIYLLCAFVTVAGKRKLESTP